MVVHEREGWSYKTAANVISDYGNTEQARRRATREAWEPNFSFDDNTIYRAIKSGKPPHDSISKAIWLWATDQEEPLYLALHMEEELATKEVLVSSLKEALGHGSDFDFQKVAAFAGIYRLYRPHHLDPKRFILVARLIIGNGDSHFDCSLDTWHDDAFGEPRRNYAEGKIVPHGPRMLAIISVPGPSFSNFILHFDEIDHRMEEESGVKGMGGIMLSAAGSGPASAWPIYARRVKDGEAFDPATQHTARYADVPGLVQERMDRGAVYWHPRDYPKPFEG